MKPAEFAYFAPRTLEEAIFLLDEHGYEAKLLAGGQSLVPLMNLRLARPAVLVDLNRVDELAFVKSDDDHLTIGAMTRHHTVATSPRIMSGAPLLSHAAGHIGYRAIRYRGTMGGSLAHADPASELPCVAVTLGADIHAVGPNGGRTIRADEFFLDHMTTTLAPDEIVSSVQVPRIRPDERWGFKEFARKVGDFAVVMVAAVLRIGAGRVTSARIGLGGVEAIPRRALAAERVLVGSSAADETIESAAVAAGETVDPMSDIHGSADYRRRLVLTLTRRALQDAVGRPELKHG